MSNTKPDEDKYAAAKAKADAEKQVRQLGFDALTARQKVTIRKTFKTLERINANLLEDGDMWLSDMRELNISMWAMRKQFNLGGSDHVCDGFDEE